jgi:nicotinate-nucleotide adenylyltransferase
VPNPARHRIGLLGGTFDPPHVGHLAAARAVRSQLDLDQVVFLVANDPWQKSAERRVTPAAIRLEMARALVEGEAGLAVDDREIRRGGPTYTADTLEDLASEYPDTDFFLIVGADTAARIHTWNRPERVRALSTLVVVNRDEQTVGTDDAMEVTMDPVDVSSSAIRSRIAAGDSVEHLTTPAVVRIIGQHGLYKVPA